MLNPEKLWNARKAKKLSQRELGAMARVSGAIMTSKPALPLRDFLHNGLSGYTFDSIDDICIVLSPKYDTTISEFMSTFMLPTDINITSIEIRLLSPDKNTCLAQTSFTQTEEITKETNPLTQAYIAEHFQKRDSLLENAQKFALVYAAEYFQKQGNPKQAAKCLELYNKCCHRTGCQQHDS